MTNWSGANLNNGKAVGPQGEGMESPSRFPAYPAYKDSGVDWLGVIPEHWGVSPLKWLAEQITDKATTSDFQVGLENIEGWTGRFIETDSEFAGDGIAFRQEDVLFGKLRPYLAKVWLAGKSGQAVGDFFVLRPRAVNSEFLHKYILTPTVIEDLNASTIGAKMPRVGWEDMAALAVTLPPHKEQIQIVRFLNHETARIDALIGEQQRLIELLKEKRQAVISQAVTKSLDPTVPMKDSGVEWLGEVPAHWDVLPVWMLFQMGRGRVISHDEIAENNGDYPVYSSQTERDGVMGCINTYDFEGDYLTWTTDGANAGTVFRRSGKFNCTNVCGTLLPKSKNNDLRYFVDAVGICTAAFIRHDINPKLMNNVMASIKVAVPPLIEQIAIAACVSAFKAKESVLIQEAFAGISLLQERRSALISAAVTGKIDVRGWQPPASAQAPELVQEAV